MLDRFNIAELDVDPAGQWSDCLELDEGWMHCRACGNRIAPILSRSELNGRHIHRRVNPGGIAFEFGIFALAPGCEASGLPVAQDSWFDGYAWEVAVCVQCAEHLGWRFSSPGCRSIYGLIVAKLVAQGDH